ncbi:MAG: OmpA family protein [Mediterranea sp.]|jgi:outer membrane protein OmpA-like peptidoglycan-associated protein|nr:OmpA family protein [Mediterranea sp.]
MKRTIILTSLLCCAWGIHAQQKHLPQKTTIVQGTKFLDNWSVGIEAGLSTAVDSKSVSFKNASPGVGLHLTKLFTPVFGLSLQGIAYVNSSPSKTAVDVAEVNLLSTVNLSNLFGGYGQKPRLLEVEAVAGIGAIHYYANGGMGVNSWTTRLGAKLNLNAGDARATTFFFSPQIVYDMEGYRSARRSRFNLNNAHLAFDVGVSWHFKNSTGAYNFVRVRPYDQLEVDVLNGTVNELRRQIVDQTRMNADLMEDLEECRDSLDRKVAVDTLTVKQTVVQTVIDRVRIPETVIAYAQGSSRINPGDYPDVERIGAYMKRHPHTKVIIKGYASPEGNVELNMRLAQARADAVKDMLVKRFRIALTRITAEGQGVGDVFDVPEWNRVSICTLVE